MAAVDCTPARSALELEKARFIGALRAPNTEHGYSFDWRRFCRWCDAAGLESLPASSDTVGLYVVARLAGHKVSSIQREMAAISRAHRMGHYPSPVSPEIGDIFRGARRLRLETLEQVRPLSIETVRAISIALAADDTPIALRDRAIILTGFASALRSANLVSLMLDDAEFAAQGLVLHIHREKQNQEGKERLIGIPYGKHRETCAVTGLRDWIIRRRDSPGPLFTRLDRAGPGGALDPERIGLIVQKCLRRIGVDPRGYSSHSMRAGFVTAAGEQGIPELVIAGQTGHRDMAVLRQYFRRIDIWRANACAQLDL